MKTQQLIVIVIIIIIILWNYSHIQFLTTPPLVPVRLVPSDERSSRGSLMRFMGLSALTPNQEDKGTSLCQIPC
jgi:hypothetical protein